ncbi:FAD-dependent oxidoreductase [Arthrobacter sp. NPDC089319]|uniref:NAD(P)/FAD-dependent oxidoreductase n=1 Tax=Arthrobacter sp. NPDC089319 TaxID=3155915 RepID=UPI00341AC0AC
MQTLVVIGASLSGLSAARAARAQGFAGRLVIVGEELHPPYDRPPLSKDFLAGRISEADLALSEVDDDLAAEWILGVKAESMDPESMTVELSNGRSLAADGMVLATGASARVLPEVDGCSNVFTLRTLDDARALRGQLQPGRKMVVVGAGFIGAETASTARDAGLDVTVIERSAAPLSGALGAKMGAAVAGLHAAGGVDMLCGTSIASFRKDGSSVSHVVLDDGRELPADLVLVGVGGQPNTDWLIGSGIQLGNGVLCDAAGRTNIPSIVAVGDCAAWWNPRLQAHHRVEHWTGALERPALAVAALLQGGPGPRTVEPPYFWSDQYGSRIQFAGHVHGHDRVQVEHGCLEDQSFLAVYYAGDEPVAVLGVNQVRQFTKWRKFLNREAERYADAAAGALAAAS